MAVRWQIPFRSLRRNALYTVNVYDENYTGSPSVLTGGAQPFVTEEDDSEDWFEPVRTQSGYISIVDTGEDAAGNAFNWRDFIPTTDTDRPVTLTDEGGTILWQGFMQAQNFGSQLYETPQERQFPVQCVLTVLSTKDADTAERGICNFAYLLEKILSSIPTLTVDTIVVQGKTGAEQPLLYRMDWQVLLAENDDGDLESAYDLLECLRNMCVYWGWSARTHGETLYLMRVDDKDGQTIRKLTRTALRSMAAGTSENGETVQMESRTITDQFANTDNTDIQLRGPSKAIVTSDAGDAEGDILAIFPTKVTGEIYENGWGSTYTNDLLSFESPLLDGFSSGASVASFNIMDIARFLIDRNEGPKPTELHPVIRIKDGYNHVVKVILESTFSHMYENGGFTLKATIYKNGEVVKDEKADKDDNVDCKAMIMALGIGETRQTALWYRGTGRVSAMWGTDYGTFYAMIGASDSVLRFTSSLKNPMTGVSKGISTNGSVRDDLTGGIKGKIFVDFYGSDNMSFQGIRETEYDFDIADFAIQFERFDELRKQKGSKRYGTKDYKKKTDNVGEEWSTNTIFATDNYMRFGYGLVIDTKENLYYEGEPSTDPNADYFNKHIQPEQQLADRVAAFWAKSKRKVECNLRTDLVEPTTKITPKSLLVIDGTTMYPVAISHAWRDDITNVSAIEILS